MLKLKVSTSNSVWCECTGEWVLRVLHLIPFQAVIRLSLLGRREGLLQLSSQSVPGAGCDVPHHVLVCAWL